MKKCVPYSQKQKISELMKHNFHIFYYILLATRIQGKGILNTYDLNMSKNGSLQIMEKRQKAITNTYVYVQRVFFYFSLKEFSHFLYVLACPVPSCSYNKSLFRSFFRFHPFCSVHCKNKHFI